MRFVFGFPRVAALSWAVPTLLILASPALGADCIGNHTDTFDGPSLDPLWTTSGACGSVTINGGELVVTKDDGCVGAPVARLDASQEMICGDFDISVDYRFLTFPAAATGSGRFQTLAVMDASSGVLLAGIERYRETANSCVPTTDAYKTYTTLPGCSSDASYIATTDTQGKFRLVRQGATIKSYYWNGVSWTQAMSRSISTVPVVVQLDSGTNGSLTTGHQVAFDNLSITSAISGDLCDSFDDGTIGFPFRSSGNACATPLETGGELVLTQSSGCSNVGSAVATDPLKYIVRGNFDIWVDFSLPDFTVPNPGDRIATFQLTNLAGAFYATIERYNRVLGACNPATENYKAWFQTSSNCDASMVWTPSTDRIGKFRIKRIGTQVTTYYWNGWWVPLKSGTLPADDVRLAMIAADLNGTSGHSVHFDNLCITSASVTAVQDEGAPEAKPLAISSVTPSPIGSTSAVMITVPREGRVCLRAFDVSGRLVETIADGYRTRGMHPITWSATKHPSGIYFLRLETADGSTVRKVAIVR